jgi:hypothetical protein
MRTPVGFFLRKDTLQDTFGGWIVVIERARHFMADIDRNPPALPTRSVAKTRTKYYLLQELHLAGATAAPLHRRAGEMAVKGSAMREKKSSAG